MVMQKDFDKWCALKKKIDAKKRQIFFNEREIWWCHMGVNVGYEQNGKGNRYARPILILKKHTSKVFVSVPLSTKIKPNNHFYQKFTFQGKEQSAIIMQIKLMDSKRLISRIGYLSEIQFNQIKIGVNEMHS